MVGEGASRILPRLTPEARSYVGGSPPIIAGEVAGSATSLPAAAEESCGEREGAGRSLLAAIPRVVQVRRTVRWVRSRLPPCQQPVEQAELVEPPGPGPFAAWPPLPGCKPLVGQLEPASLAVRHPTEPAALV